MKVAHPQVLITAIYEQLLVREVFDGFITYARHHTRWQLVCQADATAADLRKIGPAGIFTVGDIEFKLHDWAHRTNTPLVMFPTGDPDPRASQVRVDEQAIGKMAVEHFAGLGLKHLAYVGHHDGLWVHERLHAFVAAATTRGYGDVSQLLGSRDDPRRWPQFDRDVKALLESLPRPCGVLAANDQLGVILVRTCRSIGLRVPDDVAVLGVDNDKVACELSEVPLSSIVQPMFTVGYEAARMLHEQIESKTKRPTALVLPPTRVVARASTDLIAVGDQDVAAALRLIKNHFAEPINVNWIVDQLPVTRRSLYARFLKLVGRTVLQQIHHMRFEKAKELLAESDLSLEIVAKRSGFANQTWLTECFRRELKTTPRRYRRRFKIES